MTVHQPEFSSIFVKYYLLISLYPIQRDHPRKNRTLRTAAQAMQRLIHVFRLSGGGFFKCVRRFDENCPYRRKHIVKKASAVCFLIEQYIEFSISFESSLTDKVNCSIVVPLSTSRVRWNRSSTASLEGVRSDKLQSN